MSRASSVAVASSAASSKSRMASSSQISSSVSGYGNSTASGISSNLNSAVVSGFGSALSTMSNMNRDKTLYRKVIPHDIAFTQKLLRLFNFFGLFAGLLILGVVSSGFLFAYKEKCLIQPLNPYVVPKSMAPRPNGYKCTGHRLLSKDDLIPKINMIIIVCGLFFAVQAKLFGFMGSAFMIVKHMFLYVVCFLVAYVMIGLGALVEFGTKYNRQLLAYFALPKSYVMFLLPYVIVEICVLIATLRLIIRWNQFLRGRS